MTTTESRPAVTCPTWCEQADCKGEHWQSPDYYPASGRDPYVSPEQGACWPIVGVGMDYSVVDGDDAPSISLHLTGYTSAGGHIDEDVQMRPSEARNIASAPRGESQLPRGQDGPPVSSAGLRSRPARRSAPRP